VKVDAELIRAARDCIELAAWLRERSGYAG